MPFNFADILIVRFLIGDVDAQQTVDDFNNINTISNLEWSFKSQIKKFINRFAKDPYKSEEKKWMDDLIVKYEIKLKTKFSELNRHL